MPNTSAIGVTVRHAVTRALATANLGPSEATYRVLGARAWARSDGSVGRAEVTLQIRGPLPLAQTELRDLEGWVNPDGEHPNMVLVGLQDPLFVDLFPVTWDDWLLHVPDRLPDRIDPLVPRTGVGLEQATLFAQRCERRLPTTLEFQALWGPDRYPWGEERDPTRGREAPSRYGELFDVGAHPPVRGLYDLGCWLGHLMAEGTVSGVQRGGRPAFGVALEDEQAPIGFRCVCDP